MQQNLSLIWRIAITDFKLRYHGSFLGFFWTLLKPLAIFLVLNFVFSHFFGREEFYALKLLLGILLWGFFAEGTSTLLRIMIAKRNLLTKIYIPRFIFVLSSLISTSIGFGITLCVFWGFFLYYGMTPSLEGVVQFFIICLCLICINGAIGFLVAPIFPLFRDLHQIWDVLLRVGFYATPIIYPLASVSPQLQQWLWFNPMTIVIEFSRIALFKGNLAWESIFLLIISLAFGIGISFWFFQKFQSLAVEHL